MNRNPKSRPQQIRRRRQRSRRIHLNLLLPLPPQPTGQGQTKRQQTTAIHTLSTIQNFSLAPTILALLA